MVDSQTEAKRLLVEQVVTLAQLEGVSLSNAERTMLYWSESDPDFVVAPRLPDTLAAEISDEEYEKKVAGCLRGGLQPKSVRPVPPKRNGSRRAEVSHQGDHYESREDCVFSASQFEVVEVPQALRRKLLALQMNG